VILDLTFALRTCGNIEANVKSITLGLCGVDEKLFYFDPLATARKVSLGAERRQPGMPELREVREPQEQSAQKSAAPVRRGD
jgi:hypothetical protein